MKPDTTFIDMGDRYWRRLYSQLELGLGPRIWGACSTLWNVCLAWVATQLEPRTFIVICVPLGSVIQAVLIWPAKVVRRALKVPGDEGIGTMLIWVRTLLDRVWSHHCRWRLRFPR